MAQKVYIADRVQVGQPVIGWDAKRAELVKTTPVTGLVRNPDGTSTATTEAGGEYILTNRR